MKKLITTFLLLGMIIMNGAQLGGYFESYIGANRENDNFSWDIWNPSVNFELKLNENIGNSVEGFAKFHAYHDYWDSSNKDRFQVEESYLRYHKEFGEKGLELNLFFKERRYWLGDPLLELSKDDNFGDNTMGLRLDMWGFHGFNLKFIAADFSGSSGEDAYISRLDRSFFRNHIVMGANYLRKYINIDSKDYFNDIFSFDLKWTIFLYELYFAYAQSNETLDELKGNVFKTELRGLRIGSGTLGYYNINIGYDQFSPNYRNWMGNGSYNTRDLNINSYYLVPYYAITLTLNYNYSQELDKIEALYKDKMVRNYKSYLYCETYMEFIKGFKGKFYYRNGLDYWNGEFYRHNDTFFELVMESKLGYLKFQYKWKDMATYQWKHILGAEISLNITDKLGIFYRFLNLDENGGNRFSSFIQLRYDFGPGTQFFIEYGNSGYGDNGLTDDQDFVSSGKNEDKLMFTFKGWF